MTTLTQIEAAIKQLPKSELHQLATWLQNYVDDEWDKQLEEDFEAGKLDGLIAQAEADIVSGHVRDLDEVIYND